LYRTGEKTGTPDEKEEMQKNTEIFCPQAVPQRGAFYMSPPAFLESMLEGLVFAFSSSIAYLGSLV